MNRNAQCTATDKGKISETGSNEQKKARLNVKNIVEKKLQFTIMFSAYCTYFSEIISA